jgi:nucleotide-binding universal stress UspA family protein
LVIIVAGIQHTPAPNEAAERKIVLAKYPDAKLVEQNLPRVRRFFRVEAGASILGEGRGPALAWRGAARRVLGETSPIPTPADDLVRRAVAYLTEARTLLEAAGHAPALAATRAAITAAGVRPAAID